MGILAHETSQRVNIHTSDHLVHFSDTVRRLSKCDRCSATLLLVLKFNSRCTKLVRNCIEDFISRDQVGYLKSSKFFFFIFKSLIDKFTVSRSVDKLVEHGVLLSHP